MKASDGELTRRASIKLAGTAAIGVPMATVGGYAAAQSTNARSDPAPARTFPETRMIMVILGHKTLSEAERYTREVEAARPWPFGHQARSVRGFLRIHSCRPNASTALRSPNIRL